MARDTNNRDGAVSGLDADVPHSARIWNYLLGGRDHFPADSLAGEKICAVFPGMVGIARTSRAFTGRVVRHLAGAAGIRQFLDIGTGLPTLENTHEIAQRVAPECRIVYVDNDPLVLAHARALLTSCPEGATAHIDADVRDPEHILREASGTLDLTRPVGLMLMGILGLVDDYDEARSIVRRLVAALPPGSWLGLNDGTSTDLAYEEAIRRHNRATGVVPYTPRSPGQIARYFDGLELLDPGVTSCSRWRPELTPRGEPDEVAGVAEVAVYGGLGRKA